jgi:transcriptional regulator with XRE-family HTH domain
MSTGRHALLVKLGKRIQVLRKKKGWTQTDMAAYLDINRGHISDIERGKREVGIITLQIIAVGLDTTMANLLKGLWFVFETFKDWSALFSQKPLTGSFGSVRTLHRTREQQEHSPGIRSKTFQTVLFLSVDL